MTPETDPTPTDSAEAEQPASAGCAPTAGSNIPPTLTPAAIAVEGYLKNRQTLCGHLATISSTYEREKDRRQAIVDEIRIIDRYVALILDSQNVSDQTPAALDSAMRQGVSSRLSASVLFVLGLSWFFL